MFNTLPLYSVAIGVLISMVCGNRTDDKYIHSYGSEYFIAIVHTMINGGFIKQHITNISHRTVGLQT